MRDFELREDTFVIRDYARKAPFSSFLPGLAGVTGIPMWSFYTNRGQAMCGFGIHHKGNAMMEFNPANTGYENVQARGFRTLARIDGAYYEPFFRADEDARREMEIEKNVLTVREEKSGLRMTAVYFILPEETLGAVVRHVVIENLSGKRIDLELLDGMPQVIPYGIQNGQYKEMSNLLKSWTDVRNARNRAPIYKMRAGGDDSAEFKEITGGWYYACAMDGELLPVIYDRDTVFGYDRSMMDPVVFRKGGLKAVLEKEQVFANKVPCAFVPVSRALESGEGFSFTAYMGFAMSEDLLNRKTADLRAPGYAEEKLRRAVNFYMCRTSHTSSANIPLTNTAYWTKLNNLKPVVTYLILAELIKANYIDVQDLAASNAFIQTLIAQSAFIDNLEVKHLNSADGIFYGMLQFPFADMIGGTIHQYDDGNDYHYQLAPDRATSLHLKATDRYTGTPYSSGPKYIHLHLPSNVPDGVVINLISDAFNYKNVVRPFYLHGDIFYETNDEAYWGQSINMASKITYNDIFFIRLMTFAGKWYVIQTLGRADITPAGS